MTVLCPFQVSLIAVDPSPAPGEGCMVSGLLGYLESDQKAPLPRFSKYSVPDAKNGSYLHEYPNLSVLETGWYRRGGTQQILAERMVVLPVV